MKTRTGIILICLPLLALAGAGLDRALTRNDRIRFAERETDLISVYDQLLRYEHENLELPQKLSDLVFKYLRQDQIASDGSPLYLFDRAGRTVTMASGQRIRGVFSRLAQPRTMRLPPPPAPPGLHEYALSPKGPRGKTPPAGALVFEAEHYTAMNYGWEVHPDPACGGGAYAHAKEGIANGPGQKTYGVYNFYDVREGEERTFIKWHFNLARAGKYYIYGRMWTTGSHCSNCIIVGVDGAERWASHGAGTGAPMGNRTPFRWVWTPARDGPVEISAGDHFLEAFLHEDGIRVDQFMLSPEPLTPAGDVTFTSAQPVDSGTAFRRRKGVPVVLGFDLKSMVIAREMPPQCSLTLRKLRPAKGNLRIVLRLDEAGPNGADLRLGAHLLDLADLDELLFVPIDFSKLDFSSLKRREYLLVAEAFQEGKSVGRARVPLMRPFQWEVSGLISEFLGNDERGPLDGDAKPAARDLNAAKWVPFKLSSFDPFGVLDFGLQTIGNSLHAPENVTIYARTEVRVPESKEYLLKIQADDQLILWIDGKRIYDHYEQLPVTRSVKRLKLRLEQGNHRIRMRVNQRGHSRFGDGRWQASLRFRTDGDDLSNVTGVAPPKPALSHGPE